MGLPLTRCENNLRLPKLLIACGFIFMYYLCHLLVVNQDKSNAIDLVVASVVTSLELVITYVYISF